MCLLDADERERAARFHFSADRDAFITAHALLRRQLARCVGLPPETLRFCSGSHGKPHWEGGSPPHFSLSHTRGMVAVASSCDTPLGVDVEANARQADAMALAERYFSAAEAGLLADTDEAGRALRFVQLWTRKEAVVKASGLGLALALDQFSVLPLVNEPVAVSTSEGRLLLQSREFEGFTVSLALQSEAMLPVEVVWRFHSGEAGLA